MAEGRFDLSTASDSEIRALIERATSGNAGAAATLVHGLAPYLRARVARSLARRRYQAAGRARQQDVEDLVQDTFAGIFAEGGRTLRSWDPLRGLSFVGFIGMIAEREVGMRMRTRKHNPWNEEPTSTDALTQLTGESDVLTRQLESRDLLHRILARLRAHLSPQGSRYLQWLVLEGRSVQTVARQTGASVEALYAWRSRLVRSARDVGAELGAHTEHADSGRARRKTRPD